MNRSGPALSVEDDDPALVGNGSQFVLLVCDVLQRVDSSLVDDGIVVPEGFGVGKGSRVVVAHAEGFTLHVHYIN